MKDDVLHVHICVWVCVSAGSRGGNIQFKVPSSILENKFTSLFLRLLNTKSVNKTKLLGLFYYKLEKPFNLIVRQLAHILRLVLRSSLGRAIPQLAWLLFCCCGILLTNSCSLPTPTPYKQLQVNSRGQRVQRYQRIRGISWEESCV